MLRPQNAAEARHEQGRRRTFVASPIMTAIRCPYCVGGKSFKAMVAQGDGGERHMCVRCGHFIMRTNPSFKCTCAKCGNLTSVLLQRSRPRPPRHYQRLTQMLSRY